MLRRRCLSRLLFAGLLTLAPILAGCNPPATPSSTGPAPHPSTPGTTPPGATTRPSATGTTPGTGPHIPPD
jgi:hypothetical protein